MSSSTKNILFRADSSSTIGTGHIMRDLVLAQKYAKKGHSITFATQEFDGNINHKVLESGYQIEVLKTQNMKELDKLIKKLEVDKIVIDHYGIDYVFEKRLKIQNPNLKILSFDDTYEKHFCDILLNHNISAKKNRYKKLVPKSCELRCGSKYTLLRDEFKGKIKSNRKKKNKKVVFIAMGGSDPEQLNIPILKVLKKKSKLKVIIVSTTANKNLQKLQKYCQNKKWIDLEINTNNIAQLVKKSTFAIITPSVIANELYFMKIPFIAIKTASNQIDMYRFLKKKRYLTLENFNENKLKRYLKKL